MFAFPNTLRRQAAMRQKMPSEPQPTKLPISAEDVPGNDEETRVDATADPEKPGDESDEPEKGAADPHRQ
jgi:hypothetical protein